MRAIACHEPPLAALITGEPALAPIASEARSRLAAVIALLAAGDDAGGARLFVETVAMGQGAWEKLPRGLQQTFVENAPIHVERPPQQPRPVHPRSGGIENAVEQAIPVAHRGDRKSMRRHG